MANLALAEAVEHVAAIEDVVNRVTIHVAYHLAVIVHLIHASVVGIYYYNLCAGVAVTIVMNCGICLTENCCGADEHHSDYHHAEILCCHCYVCFCEPCDSGYTFVFFFWVQS